MDIDAVNSDNSTYQFLRGADITPQDDAFHGNINILDVEWWYFDGIFDNGYSIHVGVRTYHIRNSGIVEFRINIYKNGKIEVESTKTDLFSNFFSSYDRPHIAINGKQVIEFDQDHYKETGKWRYYVTLKIDNHEANLSFTGTTQGWKIETSDTCWTVALPKAKVTGTITANGNTIQVKGVGYHDHNWGYSPTTMFKNLGWFWGRIIGDTLNITWTKTMQTIKKGDLIAIVNQDENNIQDKKEFYSIPPTNILFALEKFEKNHRQLIPTEFDLQIIDTISDNNIPINAHIHMITLYTQHTRIFTAHYWRYLVKATGKISLGSTTETLDDKTQIMEYLSFKSQSPRR
ncbi:MAG: hypothetical protein JSW60_00080 [Thermoplasmatales archaeon]|nr:MAG: hypothetical protein JSW60_00080 [Thermoplasmatales archaeon]